MKKIAWVISSAALLLVFAPVLVTHFAKHPSRKLRGVELKDAHFTEVTFPNPAAGLQLAGLAFVPEGPGPFPAAIIIQGSGNSQRTNRWYLTVAEYLRTKGVAVLLPDKRGSERSEGNWRTASFLDLASDVTAAIKFFKNHANIPVSKIGVLGMSQGGQVGPIVAAESEDVAFVITVVGSSLPMYETLLYEETNNLRELGFLSGVSDVLARVSTLYLRRIAQPDFWNAVGNFDPLPYWHRLNVPVLILYGAEDSNVPTKRSADRLKALHKSNINVIVFEGSGHALASPVGWRESIFREDALQMMADFIWTSSRAQ